MHLLALEIRFNDAIREEEMNGWAERCSILDEVDR